MEFLKSSVLQLFVASFCFIQIYANSVNFSCQTSNGIDGDCMAIEMCQSSYPITLPDDFLNDLLTHSNCGIANNKRYVCCPKAIYRSVEPPQAVDMFCETPNGLSGDCRDIESCTTLLSLLRKETITLDDTNFLRNSQCGYVNNNVMVCCPILEQMESLQQIETKSTTPTTTTTTAESTTMAPWKTARCQLSNGSYGDCIPIQMCSSLLNLALKPDRTNEDTEFLRQTKCGVFTKTITVCCPTQNTSSQLKVEDGTTTQSYVAVSEPTALINEQPIETDTTNTFIEQNSTAALPTLQECGRLGVILTSRIFGGYATNIDEYAWTALLLYTNNDNELGTFCAGSLINKFYVLTAAHCVHEDDLKVGWYLTEVRLGEWDISTDLDCMETSNGDKQERFCALPHLDIGINQMIIHPQYNRKNMANDIALLRLAERVQYTNFINPICLPLEVKQQINAYEGIYMDIAGWGKTEKSENSQVKLKGKVRILSTAQCQTRNLRGRLHINSDKQICATADEGVDSCNGDSGGPLMLLDTKHNHTSYYLVGLVSFGAGECGQSGTRAIYTRVGAYIDWIRYIMEKEAAVVK